MSPEALKSSLVELVNEMLHAQDADLGKSVCIRMYDLLTEFVSFDFDQYNPVKTHHGKALDARSTAQTLHLWSRNRKYLLAILDALEHKKNVLYIGSGPFAPFCIFPILLGYTAHFTLVEINPYSVEISKQLLQALDIDPDQAIVVQTDAAIMDKVEGCDLVVNGVNDLAIRHEDSFFINKHLSALYPNAQFIAKDIELFLKLGDMVSPYDSMNEAIKRGHLRTDCPYLPEERPILITRVIIDDKHVLEPEESVITGSTYFYV